MVLLEVAILKYISVADTAKKWGVSERTVRNYCADGKIPEAFLTGKTWNIPDTAQRPERANKRSDAPKTLLGFLRAEKSGEYSNKQRKIRNISKMNWLIY